MGIGLTYTGQIPVNQEKYVLTKEALKVLVNWNPTEDCLTEEQLDVAVKFANQIKFVPTKAITPGFDTDWDDVPKINALDFDQAILHFGNRRDGVAAFHDPLTVALYTPWGGPGRGVIHVYLVNDETKVAEQSPHKALRGLFPIWSR